ncbi:unnamed protein product [Soboliphyme baturini]|uniref:ATP-dependent RNA helicase DHX37 n=1 Tax=Soboliphyme baturini TaxID=241478 RepID=A0A183IH56_9BILA|nr:unnamed protein product [Soboliphyme baturini]
MTKQDQEQGLLQRSNNDFSEASTHTDSIADADVVTASTSFLSDLNASGGETGSFSEKVEKSVEVDHVALTNEGCKVELRTTVHVPVFRSEEINKFRYKLPVVGQEQEIVEAILENDIVIPRRIAAVSMSARVAEEMNLPSEIVSYQIRYEGNASDKTRVKFMTDGVLLKEVQRDLLLSKYSVIIVDEAHERSIYSDILIGLMSRIVSLRAKRNDRLKLVIMSATLNVKEFLSDRLFKSTPRFIEVPSRMFPVSVHFSRRTDDLYLNSAYRMVVQIHRYMPDGGILVFVSGKKEVCLLIKWLRSTFPSAKAVSAKNDDENMDEQILKADSRKSHKRKRAKRTGYVTENIDLNSYDIESFLKTDNTDLNDRDALDGDCDLADEENFMNPYLNFEPEDTPLYCLPLYSMLPSHKQKQIYDPLPSGSRFCVIATNVAETSLTIPHIKYVVDTGKEKVRLYDTVTGASKFVVQWISKASANQRAGRAGRIAPGECYRLYSSAVFSDFLDFSVPEILNKPPDELVLQMKCMNIVKVHNFPFPSPPSGQSLQEAESRLCKLGLLEVCKDDSGSERMKVNRLGQTVAFFPVSPQYGKMICLANQHGLLPYVVCLVAALSVREPLVNIVDTTDSDGIQKESERLSKIRYDWAGSGQSFLLGDLAVLLNAVLQFESSYCSVESCEHLGMRFKAMKEVHQLRKQLTNIANGVFPQVNLTLEACLPPLTTQQYRLLRQLILSCQGNNLAKRYEFSPENADTKLKNSYCSGIMQEPLWIHPTSVLCKRLPTWLLYQEIIDSGRKYMLNVMAVEPEWLPQFASVYL